MSDFDSICIFTPNGKTFTFRNGTITTDNETTLVFNYRAMSDGQSKTGIFLKSNFIGYSIVYPEKPKNKPEAGERRAEYREGAPHFNLSPVR